MNYFKRPEINHSSLKLLDISYNHMLKNKQKDGITEGQVLGSLFHEAILEPHKYKNRKEFSTKSVGVKYKQEYEESGELLIPKGAGDLLIQMKQAVTEHPTAPIYLEGEKELEVYEKLQGINCKGKLDVTNDKFITDLKSIDSIDTNFYYYIKNKDYDSQGAFYRKLEKKRTGKDKDFYWVFVSKKELEVAVFKMSDDTYLQGWTKCMKWLKKLIDVEHFDGYKGYAKEVIEL